jgi:hypothetical protein
MQYNHSISKPICTLFDTKNTHYSHSTKSMIRNQTKQQVYTKSRSQLTKNMHIQSHYYVPKFKSQNHFKIAQSFTRKSEPKAQKGCT